MKIKTSPKLENVYDIARKFLISKIPGEDPESILNPYLSVADKDALPESLAQVYMRLLISAQNANMKAAVIGGSIGGVENLGPVLFGFDPKRISDHYENDHAAVLNEIRTKIKPSGQMRDTSKSVWPKYCKTILSGARFFTQFATGSEFYSWANHFYEDKRSIAALPMILGQEIYGIGYPLACDFLKELGFINYGKPDVHIIEIFRGIGLCQFEASAYDIQKIIVLIGAARNVPAYNVDKIFWLIGSGKFYLNPELGNNGRIGSCKNEFIQQFGRLYSD